MAEPRGAPDLYGPAFDADPYPAYAWLRRNAPVHRIEMPGGVRAWLVTRYDDARRALADPALGKDPAAASEAWRRAGLGLPLDHRPSLVRHMLNADPPDHARLRRLVSRAFTPRRTEHLRHSAEALTRSLLDAVAPRGGADLVADLAYPLPMGIICDLLGVPQADRAEFHRRASVIDSAAAVETERIGEATDALEEFISALVDDRLARPGEDLLSELAARHLAGEATRDEVTATAFLLLVAGHETTVALIGNTLLTLLRHPDELAAARADPERVPAVVEEVLRHQGPVRNATWRFATRPLSLGGARLEPGDPVLVCLLAANRDPALRADPDAFDPARPAPGHLAFGHGPHFCVGAALARAEARIAVGEVLRRLPGLELAVPESALRWWPSVIMRGLFSLPVSFRTTPED
ncbi:cytochrome P450 [Streptomyces capparidis]